MPLNFTKNQTLILSIFFKHPEKAYYFRQLAGLIGKKPGVFQHDINKLVEKGILTSEYQANSRFFKLNPNYHLYHELKSIFLKTVGAVGQLKEHLSSIKGIEIAFVFGSYAKSKEDEFSDVDLMIVGNPDEDALVTVISALESELDREINYNIFSAKDFLSGFQKKEVFLEEMISNPKIFIIGNEDDLENIIRKRRSSVKKD